MNESKIYSDKDEDGLNTYIVEVQCSYGFHLVRFNIAHTTIDLKQGIYKIKENSDNTVTIFNMSHELKKR